MKYLIDTNICIHFFQGKYGVANKFESYKAEDLAISEITLAELVFGAESSQYSQKNHQLIRNLTGLISVVPIYNAILLYGTEKARLRKEGQMISDFDLLIGCTAVENGLIMVTENIKEFRRIAGIEIENWVDRTV